MAAILGGTGVLMLMALVLDTLMGLIEHRMNHHTAGSTSHRFRMVKRLGAAGLGRLCDRGGRLELHSPRSKRTLSSIRGEFSEVQLINSMIQQLMEDRYGLEVTIKDQMTSKNNFQALIGDDHSCDLMYNWDGTILTTILGLDTTDIPDGMTLYDFVNQTVQEEYDCRMLGKNRGQQHLCHWCDKPSSGTVQPENHQRSAARGRFPALWRRTGLFHRCRQHEVWSLR